MHRALRLLLMLLVAAPPALAQGFAPTGIITRSFGPLTNLVAIATQDDGTFVAAYSSGKSTGTFYEFIAVLYNPDGTVEAIGRTGGREEASLFTQAVTFQGDGKIVVAGSYYDEGTSDYGLALARFAPAGVPEEVLMLDRSFGTDGVVFTGRDGFRFDVSRVVAQPDGRLLVVGVQESTPGYLLLRYNSDGSLDTTFGDGGEQAIDFDTFASYGSHGVARLPNGKTIRTGSGLGAQRFNADGSLDLSFGEGGMVTANFGAEDELLDPRATASAVAVLPDGAILVGGTKDARFGLEGALVRFLSDGTLDRGSACSDPTTAPSYAGGFVLSSDRTQALIQVKTPVGGSVFEFYNTRNLFVDDPLFSRDESDRVRELSRNDDTFSFGPALPTELFFPISANDENNPRVAFFLRVTDGCGRTVDVDPDFTITGVEASEVTGFALAQAMPSPMRDAATIRFSLGEASEATLTLYDMLGREVALLSDGMMDAGTHDVSFDGSTLPSGIYVYRLTAGGNSIARTLTVAR